MLAKDLAFYPFVKVAYERRSPMNPGVKDLVGQTGTSRDALAPEGYVMIGAELWRARTRDAAEPIPAGSSVRVEAVVDLMVGTPQGEEAASKIARMGTKVSSFKCNVTDVESVDAMVADVVKEFGRAMMVQYRLNVPLLYALKWLPMAT